MITDWEKLKTGSRILLLFSGGFDSTYVGFKLKALGHDVYPLIFEYPNRPSKEKLIADQIAKQLFLHDPIYIDMSINDHRNDRELWTSPRREGWIPFRNIIFFSYAAHHAYFLGARYIASGVRVWDTTALSDATPDFFKKLNAMLRISGDEDRSFEIDIFLPLISSDSEIIDEVIRDTEFLGLIKKTWSCWRNNDEPCGVCAPCKSRIEFTTKAFGESI